REYGVQREHPQHGTGVHEDGPVRVEVFLRDAGVQAVQHVRPLAELGIHLGKIEVPGYQLPARADELDQAAQRRTVAIESIEAALGRRHRGTADPGEMGLRIDVYYKRVFAAPREQRSEIERGGRFSHAALLIEDCDLGQTPPPGDRKTIPK